MAVTTTTTTTIDEELNQFEKDIRQLKIEYEQYFGGGRKRPPTEIEWRLELMAKRYAERSGELKFGQRFRYNNLSQTYAKYKDVFRKRLQQKEEGKVSRHFGSAAKKIEAERAEKHAETRSKVDATAEAKSRAEKGWQRFAWCAQSRSRKRTRLPSYMRRFWRPSRKRARIPSSLRGRISTNL